MSLRLLLRNIIQFIPTDFGQIDPLRGEHGTCHKGAGMGRGREDLTSRGSSAQIIPLEYAAYSKYQGAWKGEKACGREREKSIAGISESTGRIRENTQHRIQISATQLSEGNKTSSGSRIDC